MGPAIATQIILESDLSKQFRLVHVQTRLSKKLTDIGRFSVLKLFLLTKQYLVFIFRLITVRPDLVIVPVSQTPGGFRKDAIFIRLAARFNTKVLVHLRGSNFLNMYQELPSKAQRSVKRILSECSGAIVLGNNLRYIFEGFFPPQNIFVVPNGADYHFQDSPFGEKETVEGFNMIYLGNLQPSKGILDVTEAFLQFGGDAKTNLHIVGQWRDQNTRDAVQKVLNDKGFKPGSNDSTPTSGSSVHQFISSSGASVFFHSVLYGQQKLNLMAACDLLIFPPREPEGHPWVIIEAMAAGLPVITTDQGAIRESVIDGVNGFIVDKHNPGAIAEKIRFLYEHPDIREKMGRESRRLYEENFTEKQMVENLACVFNAVIENPS